MRLVPLPSSRAPHFQAALAIYQTHTHPDIQTDPAMMAHWLDLQHAGRGTPNRTLHVFALVTGHEEGEAVAGFCQMAVLPKTHTILVDYITLDPAFRQGNATFKTFAALLQGFVQTTDPDCVLVVEAMETSGGGLVRLLGRAGFQALPYPYIQPAMEGGSGADVEGCLLVHGPSDTMVMAIHDYQAMVEDILENHYLPWYEAYEGFDMAGYREKVTRIEQTLSARLAGFLTDAP
jgi:hypothetical protein